MMLTFFFSPAFVICHTKCGRASPTTPLSTHLINPHLDGVHQHILPHLFTTNSSNGSFAHQKHFWYIWKARNDKRFVLKKKDKRFQMKSWTTFQVHNAASTHFQANLSAWEELNQPDVEGTHTYIYVIQMLYRCINLSGSSNGGRKTRKTRHYRH
jgi:hypothetical protein